MIDFSLPPEAVAFRDELRAWLAEHLTDEVRAAGRSRHRSAEDLATLRAWDATIAAAGWSSAISWPVEYGGRAASVLEQLVHTEETIRAGVPTPVNVIGINNIAPSIMQYGTPEQAATLLPRMVAAEDLWCQGMSEPEAGSDLASLRTRAIRDGEDFVVDGQKVWTSNGHLADWCALFVRTDPDAPKHKGISCLLVDMRTPGIEARPLRTLAGDDDFAEVFFDSVRVPAANLLGPLHGGWGVATNTLSHERAGAARLYTGIEVKLGELVADLRAAGALDDPVVLDRLGALDTRLAELAVLCQRAISLTMSGGDPLPQASLAKVVWGHLDQDLTALGHEVLGGQWTEARMRSRSLTIAGGTTQVNKNITALRVLGLPRS